MIDHNEMRRLMNSIHLMAQKAPMFAKLEKMMEITGTNGLYDLAIWSYKSTAPTPIRATVGKYPKDAIGPALETIYDSGYLFDGCDDPVMLRDFCSPISGNRELRYDQLTDAQKRTFRFIQMKYREWCKEQSIPLGYADTK